ncbi:MAG: endonuclease III [Bacteroidales bacterium]|nr:endonuclease III [Bacteroidales bacterium]
MKKADLFTHVITYFQDHMPVAETELNYKDPYQLIVSVILSAQCTDRRVNLITPAFFEKFPSASELAAYGHDEVYEYIKSCSYPNNKAKHLTGMARMLMNEFNGKVPDTLEDLQKLPGVGRKTANVILSVAFRKPAMAVDTHVFRVAERIGLTTNAKNPFDAENQLVRHIPESLIYKAHHWLILHGRYICIARKPKCDECGLTIYCKHYRTVINRQES